MKGGGGLTKLRQRPASGAAAAFFFFFLAGGDFEKSTQIAAFSRAARPSGPERSDGDAASKRA